MSRSVRVPRHPLSRSAISMSPTGRRRGSAGDGGSAPSCPRHDSTTAAGATAAGGDSQQRGEDLERGDRGGRSPWAAGSARSSRSPPRSNQTASARQRPRGDHTRRDRARALMGERTVDRTGYRLDTGLTPRQAPAAVGSKSAAVAEASERRAKGGDGVAAPLPAMGQELREVDQADLARHARQHVA